MLRGDSASVAVDDVDGRCRASVKCMLWTSDSAKDGASRTGYERC